MAREELKQILEGVKSRYQACASYFDEGRLIATRLQAGRSRQFAFNTYYNRDGTLRFNLLFQHPDGGKEADCRVWGGQASYWAWSREPQVRRYSQLISSLASCAVRSHGAALVIPSLLVGGGNVSYTLPPRRHAKLVGLEQQMGRPCYRVRDRRRRARGRTIDLLVEASTSLIMGYELFSSPAKDRVEERKRCIAAVTGSEAWPGVESEGWLARSGGLEVSIQYMPMMDVEMDGGKGGGG